MQDIQEKFIGYFNSDSKKIHDVIVADLRHHKHGMSYSKTGYGSKIPTRYKIKLDNRYYRIYCKIYTNTGSLYIIKNKQKLNVDIERA